jgi:hypothetical protein
MPMRIGGLAAVALAVAGCGDSGNTEPGPAIVQVVVDGLPSTAVGTSLTLRSQGTELILQPGPPEAVPPGEYTVTAAPTIALDGDNNEFLYACASDRAQLTVAPGANLIVRIQCEISSRAGLFVYIQGETGGVPAAVERIEGDGVVVYPASTLDTNAPPGPVVLTARPVTGGGTTYRPTPDRIELVLAAGRVTRVFVTYAP